MKERSAENIQGDNCCHHNERNRRKDQQCSSYKFDASAYIHKVLSGRGMKLFRLSCAHSLAEH